MPNEIIKIILLAAKIIEREKKKLKKWLIAMLLIMNMNNCEAENLKFIDSTEDFGYFIDIDTIKLEGEKKFKVNLVIIRPNENEMNVIELEINTQARNYQINSLKTLSYDERTEIKSDNNQRQLKSYAEKSLMGDIVDVVMYGDFRD